ncbi:MAG: hypothetical protein A3G34_03650 [Candidatus Lindowbacteria bacterium RIFCSPLOWO2_12_FULL_62_27]|nr:MAG: hypothetical protein A3G34_03650 [Candidatus Lindowbacteria bacterium RIFCSPLOWO2_12_FULL_62_27]OGH61828.1 MAG: hypothetical protein A3I06_09435 [Candidatus Lindowbacteria bacterium RIFCSPLOWO2_02_FULL_62_12]
MSDAIALIRETPGALNDRQVFVLAKEAHRLNPSDTQTAETFEKYREVMQQHERKAAASSKMSKASRETRKKLRQKKLAAKKFRMSKKKFSVSELYWGGASLRTISSNRYWRG